MCRSFVGTGKPASSLSRRICVERANHCLSDVRLKVEFFFEIFALSQRHSSVVELTARKKAKS